MSELFNDHFIDTLKNTRRDKLKSQNDHYKYNYKNKIITNNNSIFLFPTDANEMVKIIKSLNCTQSVGYDDIRTDIVKKCNKYICSPLSHIVNLSFEKGEFPEKLKFSIIKPLHKKDDPSDMNNYRPITLIPILAKIFEKAMLCRLDTFFTKNNIRAKEQFGFRNNSSTSLACYHLTKHITDSLNDRKPITAIFLDMSKAFDFVEHSNLLDKLEK